MQRQYEKCTFEKCSGTHHARGLCLSHYAQQKRGMPLAPIKPRDRNGPEVCTEQECSEPTKAKGLCSTHYARLLRHGFTRYKDRKKPPKICCVPGCESWVYARGRCNQHYLRARKAVLEFGITVERLDEMMAAQNGLCLICDQPSDRINGKSQKVVELCIDHCHTTGVVRGLLCDNCNRGLGFFSDSPGRLRAAALYLERHATQST